jgi:predicted RNA-binding protein with PIN domain
MGVHLVIDGYNMIRRSPGLRREDEMALELARDSLVERLRRYKRVRPSRITVVFDGASKAGSGRGQSQEKGIRLIFSGQGETADTVIQRMCTQEGKNLTVVTSDRALARTVSCAGAIAIDVEEFEARLEMALALEAKGEHGEDEREKRDGAVRTFKKGPGKRPSKSERRRQQRLRKV